MTLKIKIIETDTFKFWVKVMERAAVLFIFTFFSTAVTFYTINNCIKWNIVVASGLTAGLYLSTELMRYYGIPSTKKGQMKPFIFE